MKKAFLVSTTIFLFACNNEKEQQATTAPANNFSTEGKKVIVYTTADSTNYRLMVTDSLSFADFEQSTESQAAVFVDPAHVFQTFVGIGGALTDAAAETFAKLLAGKQTELLHS